MNLENLLKLFAHSNADELKIEPDAKPYLVSNAGQTDVADVVFTPPLISQLIFPLIPLEEKLRLSSLPQIMFRHTNTLGMFGVTVAKGVSGLKVSIRKISVPSVDLKNNSQPEIALVTAPSAEKTEPVLKQNSNFAPTPPKHFQPPTPPAVSKPAVVSTNAETFASKNVFDTPDDSLSSVSHPAFDNLDLSFLDEVENLPSSPLQDLPSTGSAGDNVLQKMNAPPEILKPSASEANLKTASAGQYGESANGNSPNTATAQMDRLFYKMAEQKASDLHLSVSMPPMIRKDGKMAVLENGLQVLTAEAMRELLLSIMPEKNREEFERRHDTDFAYEIKGLARFRVNIFMDRKGMGGVFRIIPTKILTADQLGLSDAILDLCNLSKGLVVVTGPTGSGKSTTLCAMIDYVNKQRSDHIITIEDPIEFVHENQKCLLNQREVHNHTDSFKDALRAALREDPDILLVGEMRDLETISIAIETAETGHLVFGTLHTTTAPSTVDRIIDQFPADRQQQIRVMLSESLKGVIAQTLLPKIGGGRVAALEILIVTPAISNLIREGKTFQIASSMQTGKQHGMVVLNDALVELVKKGLVEPHDAYLKAIDKSSLESLFKRHGIG